MVASKSYILILRPRNIVEAEENLEIIRQKLQFLQQLQEEEDEIPKEDPFQIKMKAEQLRCDKIREFCDKGAVIVGNPFFNSDNPHWERQARHELYGIWEGQKGISSAGNISRYVNTSYKNENKTPKYVKSKKTLKEIERLHMEYLHAQQRINSMR